MNGGDIFTEDSQGSRNNLTKGLEGEKVDECMCESLSALCERVYV